MSVLQGPHNPSILLSISHQHTATCGGGSTRCARRTHTHTHKCTVKSSVDDDDDKKSSARKKVRARARARWPQLCAHAREINKTFPSTCTGRAVPHSRTSTVVGLNGCWRGLHMEREMVSEFRTKILCLSCSSSLRRAIQPNILDNICFAHGARANKSQVQMF